MFLYLISFIICLTTIFIFEAYAISTGLTLGSIILGLLLQNFFKSIIDLTDNKNWKSSQRKLKRADLLQKDTPIRISFAYLFRIKIDGQYFLVQNTRSKKYQPVGGTYKFELEEANYLAEHIPVENDDRIPVDELTKLDYRLLVKSKDLRNFVKRFERTPYRENINNLSREFQEELFSTNILDKNSFGDLSYKYCGRHMTNIEYGNKFNHFELLLADIIEVRLSTKQEELFRRLMRRDCIKYRFAKPNEIKSYGVRYETNELTDDIADHTPKILSENTDKLMLRKKHKEEIRIKF